MTTYEILVPAEIAERCFLTEALYWRAFGRIPTETYTLDGEPWREAKDAYEGISAPIPSEPFLTETECAYAGLPPDPDERAAIEGLNTDPEFYRTMLAYSNASEDFNENERNCFREGLASAEAFQKELNEWDSLYDPYIDEFQAELCLDLRRGKLTAIGRKLPDPNPDKAQEFLEVEESWFDSLPQETVPSHAWVTQHIDWSDCAIYGSRSSYIWIYLNTAEVLERYPPETLIKPGSAYPIGSTVAVAGFQPTRQAKTSTRGRPPLPWDDFHVEVAHLYATRSMPSKKEAAIAVFQEWFLKNKKKEVSRSAIGAKLKPYFDKIGRK